MSLACSHAIAAALAAASGCSLVYDADDLRAGRDGGASADADPDALFVARVTPDAVFEGEGSSFDPEQEAMVRAIPIVLEGQNMTAETVFTIEGLGLDGTIDDVAVSGDGHFAAFALRVPIADDLVNEVEGSIKIQLVKGSEDELKLLRVTGLDALVQEDGNLNTDELRSSYTHVVLSGVVSATGAAPLRIVATAGIQLDGALRADAGDAPVAGPGGCAGGNRADPAICGDGSGKAGETSGSPGGGGGGGYGTEGTAGTGGAGQAGGTAGQAFVVPLPEAQDATAHGAGGGGGGDGALANTGGFGGGSGGVIELTTPGIFGMSATALLSVAGGDGVEGTGTCTTGGGGGGGSGGAILVRAGMLMATGGARAEAPGGTGGGGSPCIGGNGGKGRIRVDRGNEDMLDGDPAPFVGPAPVIGGLPVIATEAMLSVEVRGKASESYQMFVGESETPVTFETDGDGLGIAEVNLELGLNRLCAQVAPAADLKYSESQNCVNVAYIKP